MSRLTLKLLNGAYDLIAGALILSAALFSAYSIWDNTQIYRSAIDVQDSIRQYRPVIEAGSPGPGFEELRAVNPDVVAWLTLEGVNVDYPVLQGEDNLEYMNKDVYGDFSLAGSIFLDSRCDPDFEDRYLLIYGHNMDQHLMFGDLALYKDRDFFAAHTDAELITPAGTQEYHGTLYADAACWLGDGCNLIVYGHHMSDGSMFQNLTKYHRADFCLKNGEIVFHTRDCSRSFRPVAVLRVYEREARDFPYHTFTTLADSAAYEDFFTRCEPYADWMAEERPACPDMLLTLSTCEYSKPNGRLVVICACTGTETAPQS